jgi:hypothetical protein
MPFGEMNPQHYQKGGHYYYQKGGHAYMVIDD